MTNVTVHYMENGRMSSKVITVNEDDMETAIVSALETVAEVVFKGVVSVVARSERRPEPQWEEAYTMLDVELPEDTSDLPCVDFQDAMGRLVNEHTADEDTTRIPALAALLQPAHEVMVCVGEDLAIKVKLVADSCPEFAPYIVTVSRTHEQKFGINARSPQAAHKLIENGIVPSLEEETDTSVQVKDANGWITNIDSPAPEYMSKVAVDRGALMGRVPSEGAGSSTIEAAMRNMYADPAEGVSRRDEHHSILQGLQGLQGLGAGGGFTSR